MNFAELSAQRYSLRKFSDRPVEDALLPLGYPAEGAHPARLHTDRKPMEQLVKYL